MALRIGVNALYLIPGKVGGTEIYLRNALSALAEYDETNEYFVFRNRETASDLVPRAGRFHDCPMEVSAAFRPARILFEILRLPGVARRLRLDVLWNGGFTAPLVSPCPMITVFHDLQYIHHPEFFRRFDLPFWRMLLPLAAKRSRRILVLSEAVKKDVVRFYRISGSRIDLIPYALESEWNAVAQRRAAKRPDQFILSVSTLHPHKNIAMLLGAFQQFRNDPGRQDWRLRLAGLRGFDAPRIEGLISELELEGRVVITGWIPREEIYELFTNASAFVYPSRFEGFGIPVLEALAAGVPTACSRIPSLVEIAGDAVRYFDPLDQGDLLAALREVTGDSEMRERLLRAGPRRALRYSRLRSAELMVEAFEKTAQPAMRSKNDQD